MYNYPLWCPHFKAGKDQYILELHTNIYYIPHCEAENPAARANWGQLPTSIQLEIIFASSEHPPTAEKEGTGRKISIKTLLHKCNAITETINQDV